MIKDKSRIDRPQEARRDSERRRCEQLVHQIEAELGENEYLGEPFRTGIGIIIPIEVHRPEPPAGPHDKEQGKEQGD